jgi:hypothetical protein
MAREMAPRLAIAVRPRSLFCLKQYLYESPGNESVAATRTLLVP